MRLVLFENGRREGSVSFVLARAGVACERHDEPGAIVRAVLGHTPDAIVWALRPESHADLATLRLIRLIAPEVPLLLIESEQPTLSEACSCVELKPAFSGRLPADAARLLAVIDGVRESTTMV